MEVNLKSVSKSCTETILEQMNNAFFTIKNKNNYSIGFFCHIKYENRNISVAIINNYNIGEDNKSIAYSLTFEDPTRTLTDEEVMEIFNNIIDKVQSNLNIKLRSI